MSFPIGPTPGQNPSLFPIVDPFGLRRAVVPLIELASDGSQFDGLGTAFRIDPFTTFLSAQHVVEHRANRPVGTNSVVVGVLGMGLAFGRPPMPRDCLCTISEAEGFRAHLTDPLLELQGRLETRNAFDCVRLRFDSASERLRRDVVVLPLRLRGRPLQLGERVLAVGFPELTMMRRADIRNVVTYSENMFGAIAEVSAVFPHGRDSTHPWPSFEVRGHWPAGMSGGPIFNEEGEVIGLVSSGVNPSYEDTGTGYGLWFSPVLGLDCWLPTIDPDNPGWIRCWMVFASKRNSPVACFERKEEAEAFGGSLGVECAVRYGSTKSASLLADARAPRSRR